MSPAPSSLRRRIVRWVLRILGIAVVLLILAAASITWMLRASLPRLDGHVRAAGLRASVTVERDDLGVPTIHAGSRLDVVYGLGFVHGQDRFFQMDLSRRFAAGELAALLGPVALEQDRWLRRHRMRHTATNALASLPDAQCELARAYADGVNAGLASLGARPPEYWLLRATPEPWRPEDALLAAIAMGLRLTPAPLDRLDTLLRQSIAPEAFDFFYPRGTDWDAALDGSVVPPAPIPGPESIDFRKGWESADPALLDEWKRSVRSGDDPVHSWLAGWPRPGPLGILPGSNAMAVDGTISATHAALVSSDMHLGYTMPNTFYRARLEWTEAGRARDVIAVTLPGTPGAAAGSNGRIAWAPTNANLDLVDQVALDVDPNNPNRYRVPGGWAEFERITERIEVHGAAPVDLVVRWTRWGHVPDTTAGGAPYLFAGKPVAYRHILHSPEAVNLRYFDLVLASDTDEALRIGAESGGPVLNLVVGDREGNVGWTVTGLLPRRTGLAGSQIVSWADGANGWEGWLPPAAHPRVLSPDIARVYSGNQRKLGTELYLKLADANPVFGARARQLRDGLAALTNAAPADLLAIQLDDRALLLEPWRQLLLATLRRPGAAGAITNNLSDVIRYVTDWNGRATPDSVGYRLLRGFRMRTFEYLFEPLTVRATRLLGTRVARFEDGAERPAWALLKARPPHLLNPRFAGYDDLLLAAISDVVRSLRSSHGGDLGRATWGDFVTRPIRHPFSQALPFLSRWLDASTEGCYGGQDMPRIHEGEAGAVERLVVSPGHEDQGIFHMPGGQSGHFLSPYYRAGHEAWVHGKPTPLLPGPARHTLTLVATGAPGGEAP